MLAKKQTIFDLQFRSTLSHFQKSTIIINSCVNKHRNTQRSNNPLKNSVDLLNRIQLKENNPMGKPIGISLQSLRVYTSKRKIQCKKKQQKQNIQCELRQQLLKRIQGTMRPRIYCNGLKINKLEIRPQDRTHYKPKFHTQRAEQHLDSKILENKNHYFSYLEEKKISTLKRKSYNKDLTKYLKTENYLQQKKHKYRNYIYSQRSQIEKDDQEELNGWKTNPQEDF